jgi:HEAT repeat protein
LALVGIAVWWWFGHNKQSGRTTDSGILPTVAPAPLEWHEAVSQVAPTSGSFVGADGELTEERLKDLLAGTVRLLRGGGESVIYSQRMASLAQLGEALVPQLKRLLQGSPDPAERQMAVRLLAHIGTGESMDFLLSYLEALPDSKALDSLSRELQCTESSLAGLPLVDSLLRTPPDALSEQIIAALGRIGDLPAAERLINLAQDPGTAPAQRDLLLRALAAQEDARVVPALASGLKPPSSAAVQGSLADALAKIDNFASTDALLQAIEAEHVGLTQAHPCFLALERVQSEESASCLLSVLHSESTPYAAAAAAEVVAQLPREVVEAATLLLKQHGLAEAGP